MATVITHAVAGAVCARFGPRRLSKIRLAVWLAAAAVLPDLDVLMFALGVPYGHPMAAGNDRQSQPVVLFYDANPAGTAQRNHPYLAAGHRGGGNRPGVQDVDKTVRDKQARFWLKKWN